jgi:hypothetical protein
VIKIKPYKSTEKEKRYLKAQYNELVDHFDKIDPPDENDLEDLGVKFNYMQAMVSMNVCFMETIRRVLINNGITTKKKINNIMDEVYEEQMKKMRGIVK